MSDISALSNQYDQLVETSEKINNSVIVFKKQSLLQDATSKQRYPNLKVTPEEIMEANTILSLFLISVFDFADKQQPVAKEFMPEAVKDDYKIKLRRNTAYLDEDLKKLQKNLSDKQPVTDNDLQVMDILVTTLDTERNSLFRKLRTARG